jgi:AAA family ATP:ADP antiporter
MAEATNDVDRRSGLERLLGIFTEVRAGEGITALLLTGNIFLLLTAYYVIKPVREALILAMKGGAEYKAYMGGAIAVALLFAVPAYARVAKKLPRNRLVVGVTLFFVSHLVLFYIGAQVPAFEAYMGLLFYLWVGIFNMMVVAQFWAFANDIYKEEQGKRLFALIGIGASSGAAIGAAIAKFLIKPLGVYQMLLLAGGLLALCAFLTQTVHVRESRGRLVGPPPKDAGTTAAESPDAKEDKTPKPKGEDGPGAFSMVFKYRYLTLLAVFSLLFTWVNTNGEYILGAIVSAAADQGVADGTIAAADKRAWIGAWFGDFFLYVNILGVLLQSFVVSRLVKFGGLKLAFFWFPVVALLDAAALSILPILMVVRIGKTLENASDYSINNTVRNMLWLPTTREMKYLAKQAVDTFFVRMGDVASGLLVALLAGMLAVGVRYFAIANLVLVVGVLVVCAAILREQKVLKKMRESGELVDALEDD